MSKEYIEINKETFPTPFTINPSDYARGWNTCLNSVLQHKVVDVTPVKHGRWLDMDVLDAHYQPVYKCSECGKEIADYYIDNHKYCLHCGTKMDEVINNDL